MAIRRFNIAVTGVSPLLFGNNVCSDPLSQATKDSKFFSSKNKKSDEDYLNLRLIDWVYSGYWSVPGEVKIDDVENTVHIEGFANLTMPSQNFARCLRNGATAFRLGKEITRALIVENEPLVEYDGPRQAAEMLQDRRFLLTSPVVRKQKTTWTARIMIPQWQVGYQVTLDDERISVDDLHRIVNAAGRFEGLGTWRPRYGRFTSKITELAVG